MAGLGAARVAGQSPAPPRFTVELQPVDSSRLPALQSFSAAQGSDGKWLIIGGRTNGLHLFVQSSNGGSTPPPNAFPTKSANTDVWVIDPAARRAWSASLKGLPANIADALATTNAQYAQDGNVLYIIGGYGMNSQTQQMTTFGTLTAVKVNETINAVVNKQSFQSFIQQTSTYYDCPAYVSTQYNSCFNTESGKCKTGPGWGDCQRRAQASCNTKKPSWTQQCISNLPGAGAPPSQQIPTNTGYYARVTGGGMEKVGGVFYLVFGQQFEGLYSVLEGDYGKWPVNQTYTERVTALRFTPEPLSAAVLNVVLQDPSDSSAPYHRRDLNVLASLTPQGAPRIAAHGGVFVPGQDSAYRAPIFIDGGAQPGVFKVTVDKYQQVMSQYDCAVLRMFNRAPAGGSMINVFFGGISLYYLDPKTGQLKIDTGLPFVNTMSALTYSPNGTWSEYVRLAPLNGLMGTDAKFIPNPRVAAAENGVIYLDAIKQNTMVGYVYGGILAARPQAGDDTGQYSKASNALYEVWVNPAPPPARYWISTGSALVGTRSNGAVSGTHPGSPDTSQPPKSNDNQTPPKP
jgi:hypothetical protein